MNALLNYPGAKRGMAQEIVQIMPPHRSYLELFAGSLAVLFHKPRSAIETVNDIDGDIVNFFRVLRAEPERLAREIDLTPYARAVFDDAHENRGETDFDRAVRFCIRSRMGHGFKTYQKTGFKIDVYPDKVDARFIGGCAGCPDEYGYEPGNGTECLCEKNWNTKKSVPQICTECWDRIVPGSEVRDG